VNKSRCSISSLWLQAAGSLWLQAAREERKPMSSVAVEPRYTPEQYLKEDVLALTSIGCAIPLSAMYEKVSLSAGDPASDLI
jgi:hypothetical protein